MTRIYIFSSPIDARKIVDWLSREGGIAATEITAIVAPAEEPPSAPLAGIPVLSAGQAYRMLSPEDLVMVANNHFDQTVAQLFSHGIHHVFDGRAALTRSELRHRFIRLAEPCYIGPNYPGLLNNKDPAFLRDTAEPLNANTIPGHTLFIVNSLPKSGTLWMMAMLEKLLGIKAHQQIVLAHVMDIETDSNKPNTHGAVMLVRDLRDVVTSWFHDLARHDMRNGFAEPRYANITEFYFNYLVGLLSASPRYAFGRLEQWLNLAACNGYPIIRYEDLLADTPGSLRKIMTFWKIRVPDKDITEVSHSLAFNNMPLTLARQEGYVADAVRSGHLRRGVVGAWKTELPAAVEDDINQRFSAYQQRLQYD